MFTPKKIIIGLSLIALISITLFIYLQRPLFLLTSAQAQELTKGPDYARWVTTMQAFGVYPAEENGEIILYNKQQFEEKYCSSNPCIFNAKSLEEMVSIASSGEDYLTPLINKLYQDNYSGLDALLPYFPDLDQPQFSKYRSYLPRSGAKLTIDEATLRGYIQEIFNDRGLSKYYASHPKEQLNFLLEQTDPIFGFNSLVKFATLPPYKVTNEERINAFFGLTLLYGLTEKVAVKGVQLTSKTIFNLTKTIGDAKTIRAAIKEGETIPLNTVKSRTANEWIKIAVPLQNIYKGNIPDIIANVAKGITTGRIEQLLKEVTDNGVVASITAERGPSAGITNGKVYLYFKSDSDSGEKLHELVHIQQLLEQIQAGVPLDILEHQKVYDGNVPYMVRAYMEIVASEIKIKFLRSLNVNPNDFKLTTERMLRDKYIGDLKYASKYTDVEVPSVIGDSISFQELRILNKKAVDYYLSSDYLDPKYFSGPIPDMLKPKALPSEEKAGLIVEPAIKSGVQKTGKLPELLITTPNEWNSYGIKYVRLPSTPLLESEIDRRFFNLDGTPNQELLDIYARVKTAAGEVLNEPDPPIYLVGGSVVRRDKMGYNSDLDFYIQTTTIPAQEIRQTVDTEAKNLAYQVATKANNGVIPANPKDPKYVDIMLSSFYPYEYSGFILEIGDSAVFYDISQRVWYSAVTFGTPDIAYDIVMALRSPIWRNKGNLPVSKFGGARFGTKSGNIPVPALNYARETFYRSVLPAIQVKKGFALSRSDVLQPIASNVKRAVSDFENRTRATAANTGLLDNLVNNGTAYVVDDRYLARDQGAGYSYGDMIVLGFDRYDSERGIGSLHHEMVHILSMNNPKKGFMYLGNRAEDKVFSAIYELMTDAWADIAMGQKVMSKGSHIATGGYAAQNRALLNTMFNKLFADNPKLMDDFLEFAINPDANKLLEKVRTTTRAANYQEFINYFRQVKGVNFTAITYTGTALAAGEGSEKFADPVIELSPDFITDETPTISSILINQDIITADDLTRVVPFHLSGTEGKAESFNIPITVNYSDNTNRYLALTFNYQPLATNPPNVTQPALEPVAAPVLGSPTEPGSTAVCDNGHKVGDNWPECHGCDEGVVTCNGGSNYGWQSVKNPSSNCGASCNVSAGTTPAAPANSCQTPYPQCAQTVGLEDYPKGHTIFVTPICDSLGNITSYNKEDLGDRGECL